MLSVTATFDRTILYFVAANGILMLSYVLAAKYRARLIQRKLTLLSKTIVDYFRENGSEVGVECLARAGGRRFAALVTSKPSKRFRNSYVVEIVLSAHVRDVCGLELEKVYWCFPARTKQNAAQRDVVIGDAPQTVNGNDEYFDEDVVDLAKPPRYSVNEVSPEKYEELVNKQRSSPHADLKLASIV